MEKPACLNRLTVASCRLPFGSPRRSTLSTAPPAATPDVALAGAPDVATVGALTGANRGAILSGGTNGSGNYYLAEDGLTGNAAEVFVKNEIEPLQMRFRELNDWIGEEVVAFTPYELPAAKP